MAFTKNLVLAAICFCSLSSFVQETGARDVQLRAAGRMLAQVDGVEAHSEISAALPNDGNEGDEGNEGNEGTFEGDEGGASGGDMGGDGGDMGGDMGGDGGDMSGDMGGDMSGDMGGDGGDMGGDMGGDGGDMGGDMGGDGGDMGGDGGDMPAEEMPAGDEGTPDGAGEMAAPDEMTPGEEMPAEETPAEEMPAEEAPAEEAPAEDMPAEEAPAEEMPAEEMPAEEAPVEEAPAEEDDSTAAAAAGAGAAAAAAGAAGAAAVAGGDEPAEEPTETAMAPTIVPGDALAPGPVGTRDFDFGEIAEGPAQCMTLRDGLVNASPVLQSALPSIAPLGDSSTLAAALDDPTLNVTVLLPDETILTQLGALLTSPDAAAVTPEQVQEILLDHILAMPLEAAELIELGSGMVDLITGEEIELEVDGGVVMFTLNNITATVTEPDVEGCAGESVIHRIDAIFAELPAAASVDETTRGDLGELGEEDAAGSFAGFAVPAVVTALAAFFML